jgi:hypothetical protein
MGVNPPTPWGEELFFDSIGVLTIAVIIYTSYLIFVSIEIARELYNKDG